MANAVQDAVKKLSDEQFYKTTATIQPFYNQTDKDTLTAKTFLEQITDQIANNYLTEEVAYQRFPSYLKGEAKQWFQWLTSSGKLPKTWIALRNAFIKDYNINKEDIVAAANVTQLIQKTDQTVFSFHMKCFQAVEDIFKLQLRPETDYIKFVNDADQVNAPNAAQAAINAQHDERAKELCEEHLERGLQMMKISMIKNFFFNGLVKPIKDHISSLPAMDFDEMLVLAKRQEQLLKEKKIASIEEQEKIDAVQSQSSKQNKFKPKNPGNKANKNQTKIQNSNANKNLTCWFCKKLGHIQTECYTRLGQKKPIVNRYNKVFTVNGNELYPENGCTQEELQACKENKIQGFENELDFQ